MSHNVELIFVTSFFFIAYGTLIQSTFSLLQFANVFFSSYSWGISTSRHTGTLIYILIHINVQFLFYFNHSFGWQEGGGIRRKRSQLIWFLFQKLDGLTCKLILNNWIIIQLKIRQWRVIIAGLNF